jgi:thiamine pyrophosphokinase
MIKIEFNDRYDAIIALNANLPGKKIFDVFSNIPLICADGAALNVLKIGVEPDKVVGDLDSFYSDEISKTLNKSKIIYDPDQEKNDFEKAINYCNSVGYENILIFGIHGGEYEHSLNNWSVFTKYSRDNNLVVYDKSRYGFNISQNISIDTLTDEIVSLIPVGKVKLTTDNLQWELNNEVLELGKREGARNRSKGGEVKISIFEGELIFFFDAKLPYAPKKYYVE